MAMVPSKLNCEIDYVKHRAGCPRRSHTQMMKMMSLGQSGDCVQQRVRKGEANVGDGNFRNAHPVEPRPVRRGRAGLNSYIPKELRAHCVLKQQQEDLHVRVCPKVFHTLPKRGRRQPIREHPQEHDD